MAKRHHGKVADHAHTAAVHAIMNGNATALAEIFQQNPGLKDVLAFNDIPWIRFAARTGNAELVAAVIAAGCDVNARCGLGFSALSSALHDWQFHLVPMLLKAGSNPNRSDALLNAVRRSPQALEMTRLLVESGADVNKPFIFGGDPDISMTALDLVDGDSDLFAYLRSVGAKTIEELRMLGRVPLRRSARKNQPPLRKLTNSESTVAWFGDHMGPVQEASLIEVVPTEFPVEIHVIPPSSERRCLTLFTTGMSAKRMKTPKRSESYQFAELFIQLPADWKYQDLTDSRWNWPILWLRKIARYPHQNRTWLGGGVTIFAETDPPTPLADGLPFSSFLLRPEFSTDTSKGERLRFYRLFPLFTEERQLGIQSGLPELMNAFDRLSTPFVVDLSRPNAGIQHSR